MKKILLYSGFIIFLAWAFTSCNTAKFTCSATVKIVNNKPTIVAGCDSIKGIPFLDLLNLPDVQVGYDSTWNYNFSYKSESATFPVIIQYSKRTFK